MSSNPNPNTLDPRLVSFGKTPQSSKRGGRRNQASRSMDLGINDPRNHRQPQQATTGLDLAFPLSIDDQGRVSMQLDGALYVTPNGKLALNLGDGLVTAPGSPMGVQLDLADSSLQLTRKGLVARPSASQVEGFQDAVTAVATPIAEAAVAAIPAPTPLLSYRHGSITTTALDLTKAVTFSSAMPNSTYKVFLQPTSSVAVALWPSSLGTAGFTLNLSAGVAATFYYLAIGDP